jgi:phosphoglycerate dehydrogenase-like enzyme
VGREVASRLNAFGCRILVYDPAVAPGAAAGLGAEAVSLDQLLVSSDFVSLHASLLPETAGMVDAGFLSRMKRGSFLVNTARGELVDEHALLEALEEGLIRGAALDCFRNEPPEFDHPLFRLDQVLVTPHIASHTDEAADAMGSMALQDCLEVLRGGRSPHTVNPDVYLR